MKENDMAGKGGRRGDVQLSKTARASVGDKGSASTVEWSKYTCDTCHERIKVSEMVVIREIRSQGNSIMHYHNRRACSGLISA
jgi:hypothetical protein